MARFGILALLLFTYLVSAGCATKLDAGLISRPDYTPQGKQAFSDAGCVMCHGPSARGANGPSLIPMERDYPDFKSIVREGIGEMPGQEEETVADEQLVLIYEFVVSMSQSSHRR